MHACRPLQKILNLSSIIDAGLWMKYNFDLNSDSDGETIFDLNNSNFFI